MLNSLHSRLVTAPVVVTKKALALSVSARPALRGMSEEDRLALQSISESGLFSLERSRGMYAGIQRLRDTASP